MPDDPLLPAHGGYRKLKSFQLAQLVYDVTIRFCDRHIDRRSRTHDQMVQAARSGVQNIAEGSEASATSKKMELKLTQVARASLEELRLDYEDFLRHRHLHRWPRHDPRRNALVTRRCQTADELSANAALVLIGVACALLDRQVASLAGAFERDGGFTERLYRVRSGRRPHPPPPPPR
jgi:four helix bundle suffix protein